jgi:ABC-type sugar transport system ATPase subunit
MTLADRIVVLDKGRIQQVGSPLELYNRPANRFVAAFIGSPAMNFFKAGISSRSGKDYSLVVPGGRNVTVTSRGGDAPAGDSLEVGVRPEHLQIVGSGDKAVSFDGKVRIVEQLGNSTLVYADTPAGEMIVEGEGNLKVEPGETLGLAIDQSQAHLFASNENVI